MKLLLSARALEKVTEHIDWEKLRDEYLAATYGSKRRQRKLESTRSMRNNENGGNVNNLDKASLKAQLDNEVQMAIDKVIPNHSSQSGQAIMQSSSKVNGADKNGNKTFHPRVGTNTPLVFEVPTPQADGERAQTRAQTDDGIPIPNYVYSTGSCPGSGNSAAAVPCAPSNLDQMCDKYDSSNQGKFSLCFNACIPSFCCIHGKLMYVPFYIRSYEALLNLTSKFFSHFFDDPNRCTTCHQFNCTQLQYRFKLCPVCFLLYCLVETS